MLKIRLQRTGRKNEPSFRLVLTDSKNSTKSGRALEVLGSHDFRKTTTAINADRVKYWMKQGAQPTDTVHNLLINEKVIDGKKKNVLPKKTVTKKEEPTPASTGHAPAAEATVQSSDTPQDQQTPIEPQGLDAGTPPSAESTTMKVEETPKDPS